MMRALTRLLDRLVPASPPAYREARASDAAALARLHATGFGRGWGEVEFERLLADRLTVAQVALARGGRGPVVGAVLSRLVTGEAELLTVVVAPGQRDRGLGRALLTHHLGQLAALGARSVVLEVAEDNTPARRLYGRFGFVDVGRRPGYYPRTGAPASALIQRRDLV